MVRKVIKRDGTKEDFNLDKIINAVTKAYKSEGYIIDNNILLELRNLENAYTKDEIPVEIIQDDVEQILMDNAPYKVVKAYIIYREKHKQERIFAQKNIDFIESYKQSDNTANATIDDNSNVSNHNIAVLNSEIHKEDNQTINLRIWENKLKELYPDFNYKQMRADFNSIMYPHDLSSQIGIHAKISLNCICSVVLPIPLS